MSKPVREFVIGTPLFKLRSKYQKEGKQIPKVLNGTLDLNNDDEWDRFDSIMYHMKEFSRNGAHPTDIGNVPITEQKAIELIEEPFISTVPDDCLPWDNLKDQARQMVHSLQRYRQPDEKFIKML